MLQIKPTPHDPDVLLRIIIFDPFVFYLKQCYCHAWTGNNAPPKKSLFRAETQREEKAYKNVLAVKPKISKNLVSELLIKSFGLSGASVVVVLCGFARDRHLQLLFTLISLELFPGSEHERGDATDHDEFDNACRIESLNSLILKGLVTTLANPYVRYSAMTGS